MTLYKYVFKDREDRSMSSKKPCTNTDSYQFSFLNAGHPLNKLELIKILAA